MRDSDQRFGVSPREERPEGKPRSPQTSWPGRVCATLMFCIATAIASPAQTFTTVYSFDYTGGGAYPLAGLVQATNGKLYGTASGGGYDAYGTVFEITTGGALTRLYNFCSQSKCTDGEVPFAGLIQATNGDLYGTTSIGGTKNYGTVFKITPSGTLTALYSFCSQSGCTDGEYPYAGLIQATNGDLYGTTATGGAKNYGTVFKITPAGALTTLYSFCSQSGCTDGDYPEAGVVQGADGNFYGTVTDGGTYGHGTVFKITPSGTLTTLHTFCSQIGCPDGAGPVAALVQTANGDFYGTTNTGGASDTCNGYGCGTIFKITPSGTLTTLYNFCSQSGCTDGEYPKPALIQATDGNLYGTTEAGGASGYGTVFAITPSGTLTTLYSFCSKSGCTDGAYPYGALVQDTNGTLYGTTDRGGASDYCINGCGTVFNLSVGLGPFVETQTTSGKAGSVVNILGTDLSGATSVTFNGTPAVFRVVSSSEITTTVPAEATTGTVQVVTPAGTLSSNVPFRVIQ